MAKLSIFVLYLRLFGSNRRTRIFALVGIVLCIIFYTLGTVFAFATCVPRSGESLLMASMSERCHMSMATVFLTSAVNVVSDIYLVLVPIPLVMNLQMPREKKIRICSVFMLGIL
jgi:hypothetical protein